MTNNNIHAHIYYILYKYAYIFTDITYVSKFIQKYIINIKNLLRIHNRKYTLNRN